MCDLINAMQERKDWNKYPKSIQIWRLRENKQTSKLNGTTIKSERTKHRIKKLYKCI